MFGSQKVIVVPYETDKTVLSPDTDRPFAEQFLLITYNNNNNNNHKNEINDNNKKNHKKKNMIPISKRIKTNPRRSLIWWIWICCSTNWIEKSKNYKIKLKKEKELPCPNFNWTIRRRWS